MLVLLGSVAQSEVGKRFKIAPVWVQIPPLLFSQTNRYFLQVIRWVVLSILH